MYLNTCIFLLQLSFLQCRSDDRLSLLLYLLKHVIQPEQQTVVFVATKHHAEYLNMVSKAATSGNKTHLMTEANITT